MTHSVTPVPAGDAGQRQATETVRFGVDGHAYEIDLPARQARELRSMAGRYVSAARRITSAPPPARQHQPPAQTDRDRSRPIRSATAADTRGAGHRLTDREKQELRAIAGAARPAGTIVAGRLRTKGLADRDTAGNWWLTDAGRRALMSA